MNKYNILKQENIIFRKQSSTIFINLFFILLFYIRIKSNKKIIIYQKIYHYHFVNKYFYKSNICIPSFTFFFVFEQYNNLIAMLI